MKLFGKSRLTTVAMAVGAVALMYRFNTTKKALTGEGGGGFLGFGG